MKLVVVTGSHHENSQSLKVGKHLVDEGEKIGFEGEVIDLATLNLPFWTGKDSSHENWKAIESKLKDAQAYCIVSPEWGGMVTPQLKNFFLYTSSETVGHKPAVAVSVSAGVGGAYPISELRMSGYKNSKLCYIPEHLVIRGVANVLNQDPVEEDKLIRTRIQHTLGVLKAYAQALNVMRKDIQVDLHQFPHGM